ncbi:hypothetical protein Bhyg_13097 [Pseudolycoriella hygida]|uniref:Uncharacterized protein n=1 Tax=Pseudolycoriella hygida TaxID=35572 RepID=A0A9Q0N0Y7_9DIPT|nr:hypothetical protein Bhyg_13097 [Pseudolycoriella hygida]
MSYLLDLTRLVYGCKEILHIACCRKTIKVILFRYFFVIESPIRFSFPGGKSLVPLYMHRYSILVYTLFLIDVNRVTDVSQIQLIRNLNIDNSLKTSSSEIITAFTMRKPFTND